MPLFCCISLKQCSFNLVLSLLVLWLWHVLFGVNVCLSGVVWTAGCREVDDEKFESCMSFLDSKVREELVFPSVSYVSCVVTILLELGFVRQSCNFPPDVS